MRNNTWAGGKDETQSDACVGSNPNVLSCQEERKFNKLDFFEVSLSDKAIKEATEIIHLPNTKG